MRPTLYAVIAACLAMLATSGVVVFATAAPNQRPATAREAAEQELVEQLDVAIAVHLAMAKLQLPPTTRQ